MYCIHCGAENAAAFCAACGRRQHDEGRFKSGVAKVDPSISASDSSGADGPTVQSASCWTESIHYDTVLSSPEPRERILAASRNATKGVTGDDVLAVFDAVSPIGFSLGKLTNAILPIYDRLGIKTDRELQARFDDPPGRVMLAVLCALATKSLAITEVGQDAEKCSLSAAIPSGLITNRGKLHALITVENSCVSVLLATTISGQWYDFGKSKRLIEEMLRFIHGDLTNQHSGDPPGYRRVA